MFSYINLSINLSIYLSISWPLLNLEWQSQEGLPGSHNTQWAYDQRSPAEHESRFAPDLPLL